MTLYLKELSKNDEIKFPNFLCVLKKVNCNYVVIRKSWKKASLHQLSLVEQHCKKTLVLQKRATVHILLILPQRHSQFSNSVDFLLFSHQYEC